MDWNKIKTIFIITFLILDVYLLYQFLKIRDANKYEVITEASVEEQLKADDIQYGDVPKTPVKDQYLSAKPRLFSKSDTVKLKGQAVTIKDGTTIESILDKPYGLGSKFEPSQLSSFLKDNVLYGDHYQFWKKDDDQGTITYFQQTDGNPFFQNSDGMITFTLNGDNEVVSYEQTYLDNIEKLTAKEEILPPLKVMETLYQKGELKQKSKITNIELGYSTLLQLTSSQVLAPTWHFVVNGKQDLFVNAFEGQLVQFNSNQK